MRKIGSVPPVALKMEVIFAVEMPRALSSLWQLLQVRPVVPRFLETGVVVSIPAAAVEKTCAGRKGSENVAVVVSAWEVSSNEPASGGGSQAKPPARTRAQGTRTFPSRDCM